jgi:hypothetical protein
MHPAGWLALLVPGLIYPLSKPRIMACSIPLFFHSSSSHHGNAAAAISQLPQQQLLTAQHQQFHVVTQ